MLLEPEALALTAKRARDHWTQERLGKLTGGKRLLVRPDEAPELLRVLGLLNADGSMSAQETRKFLQINHMLRLIEPALSELATRHQLVRVLDAACGNSFLSLLVAWYLQRVLGRSCEIVGLDINAKVIAQSQQRAAALGLSHCLAFATSCISRDGWQRAYRDAFAGELGEGAPLPRPQLLIALHACDTATDDALGLGLTLQADVIAVAPCCHAELAARWKQLVSQAPSFSHPLGVVMRSPNLRRETASHLTDAMRMLVLRARGYEATATEFVAAAHTPKNRLLLATRRGRFLESAHGEYRALAAALGGVGIKAGDFLTEGGAASQS